MNETIMEDRCQTPIVGQYDVIVCGGGPAGFCAAVSAARQGASVLLIEVNGCIGGIWTAGLLSLVLDTEGKGGLLLELVDRLSQYGCVESRAGRFLYDAEAMKVELEAMCEEAGVHIRLHTRVVDTAVSDGCITGVITESASGREAFSGHVFIDATGNGDLASVAGCHFAYGHPETGQAQPATLFALVSGVPEHQGTTRGYEGKEAFRQLLNSVDIEPSYQSPSLFRLPDSNLCCLMINHEYNVRCDSAADITSATIRARSEIFRAVHALRRLAGWEHVKVVVTAEQIGIREGRRIAGHYTLTADDLLTGRTFEDAVCLVRMNVDVHALVPGGTSGYSNSGLTRMPYHIPYRSLIARDCTNLLLAGRLISGDFFAHASYRVTGNAVPMGEAAGWAASTAVKCGITPVQIDGKEVKAFMEKRGYQL